MAFELTVTHKFASYKVGDHITDQPTVASVLASKNHNKVVKIIPRSGPSHPHLVEPAIVAQAPVIAGA